MLAFFFVMHFYIIFKYNLRAPPPPQTTNPQFIMHVDIYCQINFQHQPSSMGDALEVVYSKVRPKLHEYD